LDLTKEDVRVRYEVVTERVLVDSAVIGDTGRRIGGKGDDEREGASEDGGEMQDNMGLRLLRLRLLRLNIFVRMNAERGRNVMS
jgi:hypothetical protein